MRLTSIASTSSSSSSHSSSTSPLPQPFPFLASPSLLHRRVSSQVRGGSASAGNSPSIASAHAHLRWTPQSSGDRTGWSLLDHTEGEGEQPPTMDSEEAIDDDEDDSPASSLIAGPRSVRLRRMASMGTGLIAAQRQPREAVELSKPTPPPASVPLFPPPTGSASAGASHITKRPLPSPSAVAESPLDAGSSFFSTAPPSSESLSFINTLLLFDRSCATLCAVNLVAYLCGFGCLWLLSFRDLQPHYATTYQAGFWHAFHVWVCLAATLLLFVLFSQPESKKQRISAISLCILSICVLTYLILALQLLPVYVDAFGHELFPLRYLEWICTTPLMLLLVCNLDVQPVGQVWWIVACDVAMIVCGLLASVCSHMGLMLLWLTLSFVCQLDTLWRMHGLFVQYRRTVHRYPRITRTVNFLECWLYLTYSWFPAVWLFAALGWIDDERTAALYFMGDTLGKMLYTASLLIINLEIIDYAEQLQRVRYEADMRVRLADERMRSEEQSRHLAQVSNERKREFIRYLLHEVRVPLNALVLGLESLKINCDLAMQSGIGGVDASPAPSPLPPKDAPGVRPTPSQSTTPDLTSGRSLSRVDSLQLSQASSEYGGPPSPASDRTRQLMFEEDSEAIHQMWISVSNMTRLLDDVLSLQRIEDGQLLLERSPFRMQDTARGAVKMMASWLDNKNLRVSTQLDDDVPAVVSDEYRIRQILLNFLSNAIRFTPGSSPTAAAADDDDILVRVERCAAFTSQEPRISNDWDGGAGDDDSPLASSPLLPPPSQSPRVLSPSSSRQRVVFVRMSVRDRGIGLAKDDLGRLFMPFVQINAGEAEKGKGTGLGLSICRQLIEMLGGRIGVISVAGKGSEFFVEAPFEVLQQTESAHWSGEQPAKVGAEAEAQALQLPAVVERPPADERPTLSAISGLVPASLVSVSADALSTPAPPPPSHPSDSLTLEVPTALQSAAAPSSFVHAAGAAASGMPPQHIPSSAPAWMKLPPEPVAASAVKAAQQRPVPLAVPSAAAPSSSKGEAGAGGSMRVLVVDDAESNRKLLARLVAKSIRAAVCDTARDGQEAVDLVTADVGRYDVILCDKEMPVLDGYGAVRAMRALGVACPIIGVTANALLNDQADFMACGLDALVTKPVNLQSLLSAIRDTIQQRKQAHSAASEQNITVSPNG